MNLPPTVWGPFFWHTIHIIALGYPKEPTYTDKRAAKEFYEALVFLLPCEICRKHYAKHLQDHPISTYVDSRKDLFKWTVMIHNQVNVMLKKPTWTEQEIIDYYMRIGKRNRSPIWTKEDMKEVDATSFMRGFFTGTVGIGTLIGAVWVVNKYLLN